MSTVPDESGGLVCRAAGADRREAASLLVEGRLEPDSPATERFLAYVRRQRLSLDRLWMAIRDGEPRAAALLVPTAGRTAALFTSPPTGEQDEAILGELIRRLCREQDPRTIALAQALVEPHEHRRRRAFEAAGMIELATLRYMERSLRRLPEAEPSPELQRLDWAPAHRLRFHEAILASYEQTLDCPKLVGLRRIDDVVEGHMQSGEFVPGLWSCWLREGRPQAVRLINGAAGDSAAELVYLGLSVEARGRGLGRRLLLEGMREAAATGRRRLMLAVDEANAPALALYRGLGFVNVSHKSAWILPLDEPDAGGGEVIHGRSPQVR